MIPMLPDNLLTGLYSLHSPLGGGDVWGRVELVLDSFEADGGRCPQGEDLEELRVAPLGGR